MALIFESIQTPGIAELSYLIGDDSGGVAAVIDPRADVDCYLDLARERQVSITHIHADLVVGYTRFAGYLVGGMMAWNKAGLPLESVGQMTVHEIEERGKKLQLIDVRAPDEWEGGHIPNARHAFLGELRENLDELDSTKPTAVYCGSGYRASIAASILKQAGFDCVCNVPGSWQAWKSAGYRIEGDKQV